jgi:hypothetical protein
MSTANDVVSQAMEMLQERDRKLFREILMEDSFPPTWEDALECLDWLAVQRIRREVADLTDLFQSGTLSGKALRGAQRYRLGLAKLLAMPGEQGQQMRSAFCRFAAAGYKP